MSNAELLTKAFQQLHEASLTLTEYDFAAGGDSFVDQAIEDIERIQVKLSRVIGTYIPME